MLNVSGSISQMGMLQSTMQAMLSAESSLSNAQIQGSAASALEGRANVLESEIASGNGCSEAKKEELAKTQEAAENATASQLGTLSEALGEMREEMDPARYDSVNFDSSASAQSADKDEETMSSLEGEGQEESDKVLLPENTGDKVYGSAGTVEQPAAEALLSVTA